MVTQEGKIHSILELMQLDEIWCRLYSVFLGEVVKPWKRYEKEKVKMVRPKMGVAFLKKYVYDQRIKKNKTFVHFSSAGLCGKVLCRIL